MTAVPQMTRGQAGEAPAGTSTVPQQAQEFGSFQYTVNTQLKYGQYIGGVCKGQSEMLRKAATFSLKVWTQGM